MGSLGTLENGFTWAHLKMGTLEHGFTWIHLKMGSLGHLQVQRVGALPSESGFL